MNHFDGVNNQERYYNDVLNEQRKTNHLLEQLISLIKQEAKQEPKKVAQKEIAKKRTYRKKVE